MFYKCILTQLLAVIVHTTGCKRKNCPRISKEHFYNFNSSVFITNPGITSEYFCCSFDLFAVHESEFAAAQAHFVTTSHTKFIKNNQI